MIKMDIMIMAAGIKNHAPKDKTLIKANISIKITAIEIMKIIKTASSAPKKE